MKRITLVCGHYGSGKTNFALNLAVNAAKRGEKITLVDLDIVNPYFRTADYKDELEAAGVNVIAQNLEGTTLDAPALTARMFSIFEESMGRVIVDVGGDDAGAAALGRFSRTIASEPYEMWYVVNRYRALTRDPHEACEVLCEIERASRLRVTAIVANSHLMDDTDEDAISQSLPFAREVACAAGLPLAAVCVPASCADTARERLSQGCADVALYQIDPYRQTPWSN